LGFAKNLLPPVSHHQDGGLLRTTEAIMMRVCAVSLLAIASAHAAVGPAAMPSLRLASTPSNLALRGGGIIDSVKEMV